MPNTSTLARELDANGFVVVRDVIKQEDIDHVGILLRGVFEDFRSAGKHVLDQGQPSPAQGPSQLEINRAIRLVPRLKRANVYRQCRSIASRILGRQAYYIFDHAIYKPARSHNATDWHQDQAYIGRGIELNSLHFWIPLQDVSEQNGCIQYIPQSHQHGLEQHVARKTRSKHDALVAQRRPAATPVICSMRAGDVSVHYPYTMHFAGPNRSDAVRRVWIIHFGPFGILAYLRPRTFLRKVRKMIEERTPKQ